MAHPGQPPAADASAAINQKSSVGRPEGRSLEFVHANLLGYRCRIPFQEELSGIEALGEQGLLPQPQQIAGAARNGWRVDGLGVRPDDLSALLTTVQGAGVNSLRVRVTALDEIQEVFPVRKKLGITVARFLAGNVRFGEQDRLTAGGRDPAQPLGSSKENDAVATPCAAHRGAPSFHGVAQHQRRSAKQFNPFELIARKKVDGLAVRGPEREVSAFGSGQGPGREVIPLRCA